MGKGRRWARTGKRPKVFIIDVVWAKKMLKDWTKAVTGWWSSHFRVELVKFSDRLIIIILNIFYCSSIVVPISPPPLSPTPTSHPQSFPPLPFSVGPLYMFLDDPSPTFPCYPYHPSPLVTVSLFFISISLVIFCSLFVSLIRFHLYVRSHGICLLPTGLFQLA